MGTDATWDDSDSYYQNDPTNLDWHNSNFGSLMAKAAGGGLQYWLEPYVLPRNLYPKIFFIFYLFSAKFY